MSTPSNFDFLEHHDELLVRLAQTAEACFVPDPNTTLIKMRQLGEALAQSIAARVGVEVEADVRQITKGEESLFLLDEPDTHLNPAWTYDYLNLLENQVVDQSSQLFIATHNPLMIGGLKKEQVRLLNRHEKDGKHVITADTPDEDPKGMGVDGLLQSEIFGLNSVLSPGVVERLTQRYKLLGIKNKTKAMAEELERLTSELDELGIATSFPHPYFDRFPKALAHNPIMGKHQYTPKELKELEAFSDELLQEIMDDQERGDKA